MSQTLVYLRSSYLQGAIVLLFSQMRCYLKYVIPPALNLRHELGHIQHCLLKPSLNLSLPFPFLRCY